MSDYAVKITIRNGRILRRMRERGVGSLRELAGNAGVSLAFVYQLVGLKRAPLKANGEWKPGVENVAGALFCDPEDLFSEAQMTMALKSNSAEVSLDDTAIAKLSGGDTGATSLAKIEVQRLLAAVPTDRARDIVWRLASGETLDAVGADHGITKERVRQIDAKSIRQMRAAAHHRDKDARSKRLAGAKHPDAEN